MKKRNRSKVKEVLTGIEEVEVGGKLYYKVTGRRTLHTTLDKAKAQKRGMK